MGSLSRVLAVASNTFRETIRERVLYNLVFFAVLMTLSGLLLGHLSIRQDEKIIKDLGLAAMDVFGTVIAIFIGVGLVSKEIERRSLYPLLAKPLAREEFFVGKFLGVAFADLDGDSRPEIYVANDSEPALLLHLDAGGRFTDLALAAGVALNEDGAAVAGMGADLADWDNDGRLDVFVTALSGETYSLYHNRGDGSFEYASGRTGVAQVSLPLSGWGTRLLDFDNDGYKDLFVAQGHVLDTVELTSEQFKYRQPPLLLKGDGRRFVRWAAGEALRYPWAGRGAAFGDLDNDGDVDVVVSSCGERPTLLRNDGGNRNRWIELRLTGTRSNRDGLGALIRSVTDSGLSQTHLVTTAGSYQSASDRRVLLGLGASSRLRSLEVRWPSGALQRLESVAAGSRLALREPEK